MELRISLPPSGALCWKGSLYSYETGIWRRLRRKGLRGRRRPLRRQGQQQPDKNDLALILSEKECTAAATYTLNRVKAAPLYVTMDHLENG